MRTEHELRFSDGTHVPEPNIVTFMPDLLPTMSKALGLTQSRKDAKDFLWFY
jgi:hypothetical protein